MNTTLTSRILAGSTVAGTLVERFIPVPRTSILAASARDMSALGRNVPFDPDTIPVRVA